MWLFIMEGGYERDRSWDVLHGNQCEKKSLSTLIEDMGFKKDSFMVVRRHGPELKVGDTRDANG